MEKKLFVVAHNKKLTGVFSNRKKVWNCVTEVFGATEKDIKDKKINLLANYTDSFGSVVEDKRVTSLASLTQLLQKTNKLCITDEEYREESVSIQMTLMNEIDLDDDE